MEVMGTKVLEVSEMLEVPEQRHAKWPEWRHAK
jgi:hypothetical protein